MTRVAVDLGALADLVDRMQRFQDHLTRVRDDADRRVAGLHADWTGQAAELHRAAHREWSDAAADFQAALAALRSIGRKAHSNYCSAVTANQRMWRG